MKAGLSTVVDAPSSQFAAFSKITPLVRPTAHGKFLFVGGEKLFVRGVTYGTFRPNEDGDEYPDRAIVDRDFAQMAANGFNVVRTYTMPPLWLLDAAARHGLRLMISLAVERFVGYLADREAFPAEVEQTWRAQLKAVAGHAAILCYAIGNEIPAATVRFLGARRVERLLRRVYALIKHHDPDALVTYVNYPSAEYLQLPFLDLVCFNVYLESPDAFDAYLGRLQNVAGNRPLLMSEIGLDCERNSEDMQAHVLDWQIRGSFHAGCAGAFVYSWTDEWHRGGEDVFDWAFGLTDRNRVPKPALARVRRAYDDATFETAHRPGEPAQLVAADWPSISVIVCSYNGSRRIAGCCKALRNLKYPDFEVIVVDDGSTDNTGETASTYGFRVIRTRNHGLSNARNVGMRAASGEIIAYIDDDAYPDPHWLHYIALMFQSSDYVGVGGPNLVPREDGPIAQCVGNAPGGPVHVLLDDREAEHIPGCNMTFRRDALEAIGGFDKQFRVAGDDVDVCWRLQERGWRIGFSPAAVVWHHRRDSIKTYWKQQKGYGKAEALLEAKWPKKYNLAGHATWSGRIYDHAVARVVGNTSRVYHGVWGSAPFQFLYHTPSGWLSSLPQIPEWHLISATLVLIAAMGLSWAPLLWTIPLAVLAVMVPTVQGIRGAIAATFPIGFASRGERMWLQAVTGFLHATQPLARLYGRIVYGLAPWRHRGEKALRVPRARLVKNWTSVWRSTESRLATLEKDLRDTRHFVVVGGDSDPWDLEVRSGFLGSARLLGAAEEHGAGCQTVRYRIWPKVSIAGVVLATVLMALAAAAGNDGARVAAVVLGLAGAGLAYRTLVECGTAVSALLNAIQKQ